MVLEVAREGVVKDSGDRLMVSAEVTASRCYRHLFPSRVCGASFLCESEFASLVCLTSLQGEGDGSYIDIGRRERLC